MDNIKLHYTKKSGKYKCNYCGHDLAASTSASRLRAHLIGFLTKGCPNVPDDVWISLSHPLQINKRQKTTTGYILPSPSNLLPVETEGMTDATTLVLPPNGSGANNYLGNQRQENQLIDDEIDVIREFMMSTHPNESGNVENLPLPDDMIGRTTQLQHQFTTEYLIQTPLEEQTNEASLMEETPNFPLGGSATMASNESGSNLQPKALSSAADFMSQDLRNCRLTDQADQHEVRDEVTVQQAVQMVEEVDNAQGNIAMNDGNVMRHLRDDNDISWVCQFCDHPFPWEVQPETFRHHLTRMCESAPEDVKEAAQRIEEEAVEGNDSNFKAKTECSKYECQELQGVEEEVSSVQRTRREDIVQRSNKRLRSAPDALPIVPALEVPMGIQDTGESASLTKRQRSMPDALPIAPEVEVLPVGDAFGRNVKKIWSWLMDDQVLRVGICGMGGVGKTTLMRHIQTCLKGQSSFKVFWVTVSQDFSIWKLQDLIAKKIDLKFLDKEDQVERAEKLTQTLKAKGRCLLILDDLWNDVELDKVGIPVGVNTCKLVLTTRLLEVCGQMDCSERNTIQVQCLSEEEAWILFTQELGNYNTEVEELVKAVSRQCAGLPLGIRVMARSMKGSFNVHTWRNTLEELKESKVSKGHKMRVEVFSVLKFSYLRLNDPALQECLSYCALFPEDDKIDRNELIEYMIVEGIIDEKKSRQAELDKGHTMLDTLENAYLLEGDTETVWMHDLIRDMVILELREGSKTLVKAGAQLKELPDVEKWTENLVRVSLISNDIEVIPSGHTPRCPNLSTLLLCRNSGLKMIADSFFEQFHKLKILDLSCDEIEKLPRSISDLVNLTALLLHQCTSLIHVPSLAKLEKLKKLDLKGCESLKHMPEGVKFLLNLKYLDLSWTGIEEIGSGIEERDLDLSWLSRLQVLKLCSQSGGPSSKFSIRGNEVGELRMLETLYCRFSDPNEFVEYMKSRERSQQSPSDYSIFIASEYSFWLPMEILGSRKFVSVTDYNFIDPLALPTDIEALNIFNCDSTLYKRLFPPSLLASLLNLQEIRVGEWGDIEEIFAMNDGENGEWRGFPFSNYSTRSLSNHSLLNLKLIVIRHCDKLKKLFPPCLLPNLHNLQKISVGYCNGMEEIFSTDQEEEDGQELLFDQPNLTGLHLSRLTTLKLHYLPKLRSIYKGAIICHSLQEIELVDCPELKMITLPLPQPSLQRIQVHLKEWWESVQWGSANDKNHLQSLAGFSISSYLQLCF